MVLALSPWRLYWSKSSSIRKSGWNEYAGSAVRRDRGKRDILRFGVVGLSVVGWRRTLLIGSLESLRVACMNELLLFVSGEEDGFQWEEVLLK